MSPRFVIYVKDCHQFSGNSQLTSLREFASNSNCDIVRIYTDPIQKSTSINSNLTRLISDAKHGSFSGVLVWNLGLLAYDLRSLVINLAELHKSNISVLVPDKVVPKDHHNLGTSAELLIEASTFIRAEKIRASLKVRSNSKKLGRASNWNSASPDLALLLFDQGYSYKRVATTLRVGVGMVRDFLQEQGRI
jgi:DNA invertase Pin-like site-specific DNA recombinase